MVAALLSINNIAKRYAADRFAENGPDAPHMAFAEGSRLAAIRNV
jgi:hypothetical protein